MLAFCVISFFFFFLDFFSRDLYHFQTSSRQFLQLYIHASHSLQLSQHILATIPLYTFFILSFEIIYYSCVICCMYCVYMCVYVRMHATHRTCNNNCNRNHSIVNVIVFFFCFFLIIVNNYLYRYNLFYYSLSLIIR